MRKTRFHVLALSLVLALLPLEAGAGSTKVLEPGDAAFWVGPHLESGSKTYRYSFIVAERAYRLRIGLDHPEVEDNYSAQIVKPKGGVMSLEAGGGLYSDEVLHLDPEPGEYKVTVVANNVTDSNFRLRAKLEERPPSLGVKKGLVLPNLQILPPHEATFLFPVSNGATGGNPQGADTFGLASCHPEEHVEDLAVRCLRFAYGVRNTGLGPMALYHSAGVRPEGTLYQRVMKVDGSYVDREAGLARFHKTHGHYHHDAAVGLQLFKVTDRKKGTLEEAGAPRTKGFAHRMELLREWDRFYPVWRMDGVFGLDAGWADIYEWDRPGNYIDFGLNGDGFYVVRMEADPVEGVIESNEKDNFGYTYLKVTGAEVKLLEAGRGKDPWDPCKIEVGFGGHADPKRKARPKHCPPDTV